MTRLAAALAVVAVCACTAAHAQSLQRLTVVSFDLSSDVARPQLEVPFHLVVRLHVREHVTEIDNLELPILAELELGGDERRTSSGPDGTQYVETITVIAHHTGTIALAPATLQAIDARDGKPKQYFTNGLRIDVTGGSLEPLQRGESFAAAVLRLIGRIALWIGGIACVAALIGLIAMRKPPKRLAPAPPPPAPVVQPAPRSPRAILQDALTVLRAQRTRETAVRVRSVVWRMVGASDGETLADVLQRPQSNDPRLNEVLRSLERASFTYDEDVAIAIEAACAALERYLA